MLQPIAPFLGQVMERAGAPTLSLNEQRVLAFIQGKSRKVRVPVCVPTSLIAKNLGLTYSQTRLLLKKLLTKGYIEKWTTTHMDKKQGINHFKKSSYYRVKLT